MLEIEIGLDRVEYALREGEHLVIRHEMEEVDSRKSAHRPTD
jgi:alpha,alpha-trehalose phosphorylase